MTREMRIVVPMFVPANCEKEKDRTLVFFYNNNNGCVIAILGDLRCIR